VSVDAERWLRGLARKEPLAEDPPQRPHPPKVPQHTRGSPGFPADQPATSALIDQQFREEIERGRGEGGWHRVNLDAIGPRR
jgi:hypothetical protein